jgi:hypothetical protein
MKESGAFLIGFCKFVSVENTYNINAVFFPESYINKYDTSSQRIERNCGRDLKYVRGGKLRLGGALLPAS